MPNDDESVKRLDALVRRRDAGEISEAEYEVRRDRLLRDDRKQNSPLRSILAVVIAIVAVYVVFAIANGIIN